MAWSSIAPVASFAFSWPGWRGSTSPSTATTNSLRTRSAVSCASGASAASTTTWVIPWRSRRSMKIELAVVPPAMDPAGEPGRRARIVHAQIPARVRAIRRGERERFGGHGKGSPASGWRDVIVRHVMRRAASGSRSFRPASARSSVEARSWVVQPVVRQASTSHPRGAGGQRTWRLADPGGGTRHHAAGGRHLGHAGCPRAGQTARGSWSSGQRRCPCMGPVAPARRPDRGPAGHAGTASAPDASRGSSGAGPGARSRPGTARPDR